jgi:hypothetical protein
MEINREFKRMVAAKRSCGLQQITRFLHIYISAKRRNRRLASSLLPKHQTFDDNLSLSLLSLLSGPIRNRDDKQVPLMPACRCLLSQGIQESDQCRPLLRAQLSKTM